VLFFGFFCFFVSLRWMDFIVLSTSDLKVYELRRGQTTKIRFDRKDMILV
jgi:hypothetical protein